MNEFLFFTLLAFAAIARSLSSEPELEWLQKMEEYRQVASQYGANEMPGNARKTGTSYFNVDFECGNPLQNQFQPRDNLNGENEPNMIYKHTIQSDVNVAYQTPTSVHELRPGDIKVVAAIGDSITAGSGAEATSIPGIAIAFRGVAWTMGGEESLNSSMTLPNILRTFNPALNGYSMGQTPPDYDLFWFNEAIPGARAKHLPNQVEDLVQSMKNDTRINFEEDWKTISVFIGGNDLCALKRDNDSIPTKYIEYLGQALDMLHAEIPRVIVNLVEIMEIYLVREVGYGEGGTVACRKAQSAYCPYVFDSNETELEKIKEINAQYQILTEELINSGRYDTTDDFTVVIQPFLKDTVLPRTESGKVDTSYFAPDCFHFSTKGHAMGALNLWNNMLQPVGQKSTSWIITDLKCPTQEHPFIFTRLNSPQNNTGTTTTPATTTKPPSVITNPLTTTLATIPSKPPGEVTKGQVEETTSGAKRISYSMTSLYILLIALSQMLREA